MDNPVISFLREHPRVIFSPKSVSRRTRIQIKHVVRMAHKHPNIRLADPLEVGSGRSKLTLLTIRHEE
jgi:hypothetical protein